MSEHQMFWALFRVALIAVVGFVCTVIGLSLERRFKDKGQLWWVMGLICGQIIGFITFSDVLP